MLRFQTMLVISVKRGHRVGKVWFSLCQSHSDCCRNDQESCSTFKTGSCTRLEKNTISGSCSSKWRGCIKSLSLHIFSLLYQCASSLHSAESSEITLSTDIYTSGLKRKGKPTPRRSKFRDTACGNYADLHKVLLFCTVWCGFARRELWGTRNIPLTLSIALSQLHRLLKLNYIPQHHLHSHGYTSWKQTYALWK